jgi:hypothetical protein
MSCPGLSAAIKKPQPARLHGQGCRVFSQPAWAGLHSTATAPPSMGLSASASWSTRDLITHTRARAVWDKSILLSGWPVIHGFGATTVPALRIPRCGSSPRTPASSPRGVPPRTSLARQPPLRPRARRARCLEIGAQVAAEILPTAHLFAASQSRLRYHSNLSTGPIWRNGRRSRLKICWWVTTVRVRVPLSVCCPLTAQGALEHCPQSHCCT